MNHVTVDGRSYSVLHQFSPTRVLVNYDGLVVFVDQNSNGTWDLSGEPAREEEKAILSSLIPAGTTLTVTPPKT